MSDACGYGTASPDDPVSLACDYTGMYETHYCEGAWSRQTQSVLDQARNVRELALFWKPLAHSGHVDSYGGAEWHHALAHLRWNLENE